MSRTKYLKGVCSHCEGRLEFPAEAIDTVTTCPHCGQPTELQLALPPSQGGIPTRTIVWTVVAILILGLGLAGVTFALTRAQKMAARKTQKASTNQPSSGANQLSASSSPAAPQAGYRVSNIDLEKAPGSSLVHAVGTVQNTTAKQRFGVKIELDLLDGVGKKIGTAQDYQPVLEPNAQWRFKALVIHSKTVSAKLASIKEDQ